MPLRYSQVACYFVPSVKNFVFSVLKNLFNTKNTKLRHKDNKNGFLFSLNGSIINRPLPEARF